MGSKDEMTLSDQNGKQVDLPKEERKAIIIAMSLHEKGRSAMKKRNFALAIVLLLEAKDEYQRCSSALLNAVDNYGLLNLDIGNVLNESFEKKKLLDVLFTLYFIL